MGKDGHVGSLYPDRKEVTTSTDKWVLSVDKKSPSSITLSLPVMNSSRNIRIVLTGADKAEAALTAIEKLKSTLQFPVCGVVDDDDSKSRWMIDLDAASLLPKNSNRIIYKD
jgi:6-phosphogluconolactonase